MSEEKPSFTQYGPKREPIPGEVIACNFKAIIWRETIHEDLLDRENVVSVRSQKCLQIVAPNLGDLFNAIRENEPFFDGYPQPEPAQ